MDIISLYFDSDNSNHRDYQQVLFQQFIHDLLGFQSNKTTPRVMFADVIDKFSELSSHVNVSSWSLHPSPGSDPYGSDNHQVRKQQYQNIQETIELKVTFVERLFSEMGGVRENVTHIGVIFLDGSGLSYEDSRSVIVEQQSTDIAVFVMVMFADKFGTYTIFLSDTLVVDQDYYITFKHILIMAMCNQCMESWFKFEHNDVTNSVSCYKLMDSKVQTNWHKAIDICYTQYANLATIETVSELNFLRTILNSYFIEFESFRRKDDHIHDVSAKINIALYRDTKRPAKRFHWWNRQTPLVVNNWMPGKPSGGRTNECGVWQFLVRDHYSDSGSSDQFVDGWVDVNCGAESASLTLCEINFPRRIENRMGIKPAKNESFTRALTKGDLITFRENIVSISANIVSQDFLLFLKQSGIEFPVFDCGIEEYHPRYISWIYVCDNIDHCSNNHDETLCTRIFNDKETLHDKKSLTTNCKGVHCNDGLCLPLQLVNDGEIDCFVCGYGTEKAVHDESEIIIYNLKRNESCAFICNIDQCISLSQLNDDSVDCFGEEGPLDETIGKLQTADTCYNSLGHSIWAPMCVYVVDRFGTVLGCRDVSHLYNCTSFECPDGYFKFPNTYCIPQHYVLDEKPDCPVGEDEQRDIIIPCSGNFACWDSQICLFPDLVCDGHPDCPFEDDELDCDVSCPQGFRCISGTVTVSDYNRSIPFTKLHYISKVAKYMDLSGVDLSTSNFPYFISITTPVVIIWSKCKIKLIDQYFAYFLIVRKLDLSYNLIEKLDGSYIGFSHLENVRHLNLSYNTELVFVKYLQMTFLETLDLSHTGLTDIDGSFLRLSNLKHLNLSFTFVTEINKNWLPPGLILQTFDLRGITIKNVLTDIFNGLTILQDLYTDRFELCCPQIRGTNIPYYACHAPDEAISSCFDLIGVNVQRVLLWLVAVLAVLGNIAVIGYRVIWERSLLKTGYGLFVINLSISDFIMGVYMFIIAGADYYFRGSYVLYDKSWRESSTCKFAGFLATLSNEMSICFIFLITLDRFLMMKFPFGQIRLTKLSRAFAVLLSWIIGLLLAMSPHIFNFEIYSSNAMCIALPLTTKRIKGWEFSFGVFTVFNFLMCLVIVYGQRAIFRAISENRITETASSTSFRRIESITIAKQLFLIAFSNFVCWFPLGLMGLMSLGNHEISKDVYAWTTVIVLPINSAANPLLYTIPVIMKRWEKFKNINIISRQRRS